MKFIEYEENYNYAPFTLEEFAHGAKTIEDNIDLAEAAKQFLETKEAFENALEEAGIEFG